MYKQVETDAEIEGGKYNPVATLADEYGGRVQIVNDDHCFVLMLRHGDGSYQSTAWIFREAFEVLKTLPSPK